MTHDLDTGETADSPDTPVQIESESHLTTVVNDHDTVLVDFYADWCGPCKMLEPVLEDLAADTPATIAKVDVDQHQHLASAYGVRGVPTLVFFSGGDQVDQVTGALPADQLRRRIEQYTN